MSGYCRRADICNMTLLERDFAWSNYSMFSQWMWRSQWKHNVPLKLKLQLFLQLGLLEEPCCCEPLCRLLPCKLQPFFHLALFFQISPESCLCFLPWALWAHQVAELKVTMRTDERPLKALLFVNDGALSSGAPRPRDSIPPPRGQKLYILVWCFYQDGGGLSEQVFVVQTGETEL